MPGGKSPKSKGDRAEREVIKLFGGERTFWQPEQGEQRGDIINMPYLGRCEVKIRYDGFKQLYKWLADNGGLFVRADRKPWLVVMPAKDLKAITDELDELKRRALK
jgi:hypothetical protein